MATFEEQGQIFCKWLKDNGTTLSNSIAIKDYRSEGAGRGVVAVKDIKEGDLLFSIPRSMLLSSLTTSLKDVNETIAHDLAQLPGWTPLIITMMYENQKPDSFWKPYFDVLPRQFSTPMFWSESDLKELEGTDIIAKIGKEEAEESFEKNVMPFMEKYASLFDKNVCTMELFHTCGSLIMAYSFNDELQKAHKEEEGEEDEEDEEDENEDEDEDKEEDKTVIDMVPMADMLNHKTGYNNARLFHEQESLQMKAIKDIQQGEQIYNTYGDLCNADLLRKYGFADEKNELDIVELDGLLVVKQACSDQQQAEDLTEEKVDFLMEEGAFDECFVLDTEHDIPLELVVSVQVLQSTKEEFQKMVEKQKLPKPRLTKEIKKVIEDVLQKRLERYSTSLKDDEEELNKLIGINNKRNALLVRIGEKKILESTLEKLKKTPVAATEKRTAPTSGSSNNNKKHKKK